MVFLYFSLYGGSERRGMGFAFHQLCPRYSGTLTPTAPTAIRLWETFTFFNYIYGKIIINSAYMHLVNLLPKRFRLAASAELQSIKMKTLC